MSSESIEIKMGDWMINAGLVGLCNILEYSGDKVSKEADKIIIDSDSLNNFDEKYFKYFIDTYLKTLSWYKIVSYRDTIKYFEDSNFKDFDEASLESLNDYITKTAKYYIKSSSYKAAYELIEGPVDIFELEKNLTPVKFNKKDSIENKLPEIKETYETIKEIINYFTTDKTKKYLAGKNVIYTIINNGWNGVSFLNKQTKEKDMYIDYNNYFVKPVMEHIKADKSKYKYNCFICESKMKDMSNDVSFLNDTGFDVARKSSHVWDFINDVAICNVCKLIYSCIPAGITYAAGRGIFINANSTVNNLIITNGNIKAEVLQKDGKGSSLTYRSLITSIQEQFNVSSKYELSDVQVVRYEQEKYRFNILSKNILKVIFNSKDELNKLINCGFKEINTYFNIYDLVINNLLNNRNLIVLLHKLLIYKISNAKDCRYSTNNLSSLLKINYNFMKEIGYMGNSDKDVLDRANSSGYYLRQAYKEKGAVDKLNGIAYRLLNSLKTNNRAMFMDTMLNCYLYVKKEVPEVFLDALKDEDTFKHIGYAFVMELVEGKKNENGGRNNE